MWFTGAKIWNGTSEQLSEADSIKVENGQIISLGNSASSSDAVDCGGLTLIPGLIDAHVHVCLDPKIKDPLEQDKFSDEELLQHMAVRAGEMLLAGITTARDLGGGRWLELKLRDLINDDQVEGCRLVCAGQPVTSVNGHCHFWGGEAEDLEAATEVIQRQIDHGVDLIKIMATGGSITPGSTPKDSQFSKQQMQHMVTLAKTGGFRVAAHCHGSDGISNAADAGVTTIEHCSWVGEAGWARDYRPDVVESIVNNGVWVSPTINAGWKRYIGTKTFEDIISENYKKMRAAGVKLIASTDAGIPGVFHPDLPKAIPVFAHFAGLTPVEALRSATSDCAEAIGLGSVTGQIAPGFSADFVAYEGNPLEDLEVLASPSFVVTRGRRRIDCRN